MAQQLGTEGVRAMLKVPKFVQEMMGRARFDRSYTNPTSDPGYTVWIRKATPYARAATLRAECERLVAWARRNYADAEILECPENTHYCNQAALVTITDPVMQKLEKFMPEMKEQKG